MLTCSNGGKCGHWMKSLFLMYWLITLCATHCSIVENRKLPHYWYSIVIWFSTLKMCNLTNNLMVK